MSAPTCPASTPWNGEPVACILPAGHGVTHVHASPELHTQGVAALDWTDEPDDLDTMLDRFYHLDRLNQYDRTRPEQPWTWTGTPEQRAERDALADAIDAALAAL